MRRLSAMESIAEENGTALDQLTLAEQETLWQQAKLQDILAGKLPF